MRKLRSCVPACSMVWQSWLWLRVGVRKNHALPSLRCPVCQHAHPAAAVPPALAPGAAGGIQRYLEAFPDGGFFKGKNFVFDERVDVEGGSGAGRLCRPAAAGACSGGQCRGLSSARPHSLWPVPAC